MDGVELEFFFFFFYLLPEENQELWTECGGKWRKYSPKNKYRKINEIIIKGLRNNKCKCEVKQILIIIVLLLLFNN